MPATPFSVTATKYSGSIDLPLKSGLTMVHLQTRRYVGHNFQFQFDRQILSLCLCFQYHLTDKNNSTYQNLTEYIQSNRKVTLYTWFLLNLVYKQANVVSSSLSFQSINHVYYSRVFLEQGVQGRWKHSRN